MQDGTVAHERLAHNLVRRVDADTTTAVVAIYGADISQYTVFPQEGVHGVVWIGRVTRNYNTSFISLAPLSRSLRQTFISVERAPWGEMTIRERHVHHSFLKMATPFPAKARPKGKSVVPCRGVLLTN